ncbi:hypothetical protein PLEOSDRAFT_1037384 [Pleurotus ostreatus PC15]|uniref:WLM domain-containing protein n=1 Tax=Pleurotus ostreatus (strain PC15) TaxID=1137138 RepID=A0A067NTK0_PLEO1|nr:hypothetical protein PLEOSDRAFT_1037384 [Pleurotus ostreatus PC15]
MSETFIKTYTHLKDRPKADRALHMLQTTASLVKPIMRKHGWVLPVLSEFYPDDPHLVDVNGGQKILLRLRLPHDAGSFYDEEQVVLVMLHELTHNVHGPHDDKFYKFLSELEAEYEALKRSGYSGEGFFSKGHRVGTNVSHNLPPHQARAKALEAAEKRRKVSNLIGQGGRLGGVANVRNLTPRELAAQAAERRARDAKSCAYGVDADREAAKAVEESIESNAIDLTGDSDDEVVILNDPTNSTKVAAAQSDRTATATAIPNVEESDDEIEIIGEPIATLLPRSKPQPVPTEWSCPTCTLLNPMRALTCDACLTPRPINKAYGWMCHACGEYPMPHEFWTCRSCGTMKASS